MAIRDGWKFIEKTAGVRKKRTQADIFTDSIKQQIELAEGKEIKNAKGKAVESWEVETGVLRIKVGRRKLFENDIDMGRKKIKTWLTQIEKAHKNNEFAEELAHLQAQQDEEDARRAEKLKNKVKKK